VNCTAATVHEGFHLRTDMKNVIRASQNQPVRTQDFLLNAFKFVLLNAFSRLVAGVATFAGKHIPAGQKNGLRDRSQRFRAFRYDPKQPGGIAFCAVWASDQIDDFHNFSPVAFVFVEIRSA
jgi:hypothetical protein